MTEDRAALDQLPASMRESLETYATTIRDMAGSNALALTVFGAIAAGTFDPSLHTARSAVVLQHIDLELLRRLAKGGSRWGKARIAAPLIMTPDYIKDSVDTFPLEFLEIQQRHLCLFGPDYFAGLTFQDQHLRWQCERELKTILIGMRQALLAAAGRERLLAEIEGDVVERLLRTLRGLLWLHGRKEATPAVDAVTAMEHQLGRSLPGIRGALDEQGRHTWNEFKTLYEEVDALRTIPDAW